ncbi:hypothetical protein TSUD_323180 [Trifolium subterraneum]|uniref:Uncharacterized protein n=1 Tax=Trifolium subterraneum TaxID=3900 RepID=A0A2Z6N914_TRISU|nr:hypothetical protein TSUD_323180 [Trifolium subterraneum]
MFGFTVKSSDFESGTSDSDSDSDSSGHDSDCVIISSSEFSSRNPNNRSLIVVSGEGGESRVVIDPVAVGEFVTTINEQEPHYFYMYTHVIQTLNLWLPFNSFECQILRVMNVAPCQLHPNSWEFLKAFQISCEWEGFPELMFDAAGNRLFPFYWSSAPRLIKGTRVDTLNEYERQAVAAFTKFHVMSSGELLARENKPNSLGEYMSSMSTLSAQQRAVLVLKARVQRAEAERAPASADVMTQLVVEESGVKSTKRKNPEESGRIPIEITKKMKNIVVDEEEAEIEDDPLKFRRVSKGRGLTSLHSGAGGSNKYARTSHLYELTFEDLRQATMNHHIQGALLTYYLSNRQELESIDFKNKMESADNSLSALERELAAAKSKFEEDLAAVKAEQEQKVKAAVKAKYDEVIALKGKVKALEGELAMATQGKEEASQKVDTLTAKVDALEMDVASQYDDGFRFSLDQVKVAFPDVGAVKLGELDYVNQIVDGNIVAYMPPSSE